MTTHNEDAVSEVQRTYAQELQLSPSYDFHQNSRVTDLGRALLSCSRHGFVKVPEKVVGIHTRPRSTT